MYIIGTPDIKLTPLVQSIYDNYFDALYTSRFNEHFDSSNSAMDMNGIVKLDKYQIHHLLAIIFGIHMYYVNLRNTTNDDPPVTMTYDDFDAIWNFNTIRKTLACYDIDILHVFQAVGLFGNDIVVPATVLGGIYYPSGNGTGTTISYELNNINLIKGWNIISHNKNGIVMYCTVFYSDGNAQTSGWSLTNSGVTDEHNQVAIYSTTNQNNCTIKLIIDIS